jgi:oxalate decarboxylase/phosphoglucose isomerase-like protein (cupin superfamily)
MLSNQLSRSRTARITLATLAGALTITMAFVACEGTATDAATKAPVNDPMFTVSSGSQSTLLARANFAAALRKHDDDDDEGSPSFKVKRTSPDWRVEVKAKPNLDLAVQDIVFAPGGQSGWHQHPGPVFILVKSGTMTFYEADDRHCRPIVRTAGQGYLDEGLGHIARNETTEPAENIVVYLAPQAAALRIDIPIAPGNCPF